MKKKEDVKETSKGKSNFKLVLIILSIIVLTLLIIAVFYYFNKQSSEKTLDSNQVIIENPMKQIVEQHLEKNEQASMEEIVQEGINNFNVDYINYILLAFGVDKLHSFPGFGNPIVELALDNEIWSSEISGGRLITKKSPDENRDLRFTISKEEAVRALLSQDIKQFMKDSVMNGRTRIEMISGKPELLAKGYLDLYSSLNS